jgi:hypothetical protein
VKSIIFLLLSFVSVTAFSADWNKLERHALHYFQGATELPFIISRSPVQTGTFQLYSAITRIEVSNFENPARQAYASAADLAQTFGLGSDTDYVEMYMYSETRIFNCAVTFKNGDIVSFENCRTRELGYGSWQTLQPN